MGCESASDCSQSKLNSGLRSSSLNFSTSLLNYANDESTENCEAYREALKEHTEELKRWDECGATLDSLDIPMMIQVFEQDLKDLEC